jgi:signal transduction histidine kinase/ActR/RegA family two-component response regulator
MAAIESQEQRVLVLAPTGRDASLIGEALRAAGLQAEICRDMPEVARKLEEGAAAGLLAEEALDPGSVPILIGALRGQPAWSDLPVVLMTSQRGPGEALAGLFGDGFNITLLERPVRMQTLTSVLQGALRQRRRQYELRNHLAEQQQTEERLRQTQKLESLGVLAGGVAHDFNNLLTGIIGNASLVRDDVPRGSAAWDLLENALQASQRAADLTRQLLAYSGKGRFVIEPIDLSDLVRQISMLVHTSISKSVEMKLDLAQRLPCIIGDPSQIQQVIMNLVINAAEAIGPDCSGTVLVQTDVEQVNAGSFRGALVAENPVPGKYVYLEVRDTGCGIDQAELTKIFDPFFTTKFMGRGLGLAAVQGIVRGHKGMLKVDSVPGDGSTFRVLFPATEDAPVRPQPQMQPKDLTGTGTILVVDDEEIVRKVARNALESYGYTVILAENGQIAIDLFRGMADQFAAVLLDMTMPVMGGEETLRHLQRIHPRVKVILTSGYNEVDAIRRFTGAGLAGFLQKPYTAGRLAEKIKAICAPQPAARGAGCQPAAG